MLKSFKSNPSILISKPNLLQEYYMYLKTTLTCDRSLSSVERDIFTIFYEEYFTRHTLDFLLNTKIDLYKKRIKPIHLNIKGTPCVLEIETLRSPTDILERYLEFIENNKDEEHDDLMNILVYSILKSGIRNFKVILSYIKIYRRKVFINCEHIKKRNESEIEYYLKVLEISLEFIERMEFKDLNVTKEEYEKLIGISK